MYAVYIRNESCFLVLFGIENLCTIPSYLPPIIQLSCLKNVLVESSHRILLDRHHNSLECLVSLALVVVVLHIIHRGESSLNGDVEAAVARIGNGLADGGGDDIRLSVLDWNSNVSF